MLVISLALGFVYLFTQQMIEWPGTVLGAREMARCHPFRSSKCNSSGRQESMETERMPGVACDSMGSRSGGREGLN